MQKSTGSDQGAVPSSADFAVRKARNGAAIRWIINERKGLVTTVSRESALTCCDMDAFPEFMKHPANRIARSNQATPGVEGYVFDGANESQMAFWTCGENATSAEHVHDYDEYMVVVQGCYTLVISGRQIAVNAGEEYFIPRGVPHSGEVAAGTRTIHAFGGHRADRETF